MRNQVRRLLVMRHAKAEAVAASDHERRLVARGREDAEEAGRWARREGLVPDHVFASTAARALETWSAFTTGAALELEPQLEAGLYSAGPDGAIEVLRTSPAAAMTVMIVGHNPTMAQLVHLLDDGRADPAAFERITSGFPTAAIAVLEVAGEWDGLEFSGARIAAAYVGRGG